MSRPKSHAFESSLTSHIVIDVHGDIRRVNRTFLRSWGFENDEAIIGRTFASCFHNQAEVAAMLEALGPTGEWTGQMAATRRDGTAFVAHVYVSAESDNGGALSGYQAACLDVTVDRQARDALMEAQRFRDKIIEASLNGIYIYDLEKGNNVYQNKQYATLTGHTLESLNAMSPDEFFELFHPDDRELVGTHLAAVAEAEDGEILELEYQFKTADGRWIRCLSCHAVFERDEKGEVRQMIGTFLDITKRWKGEQELRYHAGLLSSISDAVISVDNAFNIRSWNKAAEEMYGWTEDEVVGKPFPEVVRPIYVGKTRSAAVAEFYEHSGWRGEVLHHQKDGKQLNILTSVSMIRDGSGNPVGAIAVNRDITERKVFESRAVQADRLASVGLLAAGVAHEINNPLTFVLYNIENLAEDLPKLTAAVGRLQTNLDSQLLENILGKQLKLISPNELDDLVSQVEDAAEGAHRVRDIVKDLKTFSRSDEARQGPVFLNDVLESAINIAYSEIRTRARLVKEYGLIPTVFANDGRLAQVFLNLLLNAAQAIEEGNVSRNEIRVRTWAEGGHVCAEVRDSGIGIPPEDLPHLFQPFFSTKEVGVGSGLGLAICGSIVAGYSGRIDVDSTPGEGSSFIVRLPSKARYRKSKEEPAAAAETPALRRGRLLIIDDEPHIVAAMRRMLSSEHRVVTATSGSEAMEVLRTDRGFDAIICDLVMPDVTGIDLHEWVSAEYPDLVDRMVFVSGGAFTPRVREFLERVSNRKFEKPFEPRDLKACLKEMVAEQNGPTKAVSED